MSNNKLLHEFLMHELEPADFTHQDHVEVAWRLLAHHSLDESVQLYSDAVRNLATRAGAREKFHVTITRAMIQLIACDREAADSGDWNAYCASHPPALEDALKLLLSFYSKERLFSDMARTAWVDPDLMPLPRPPSEAQRNVA